MKKKELLKLIKTKSQEVEIKDFSQNIIDRVKYLPHHEEQVVTAKRKFRFQPYFIGLLTTMAAIFAFVVFYQPGGEEIVPQFEDIDQIIAFSALSTASLIEIAEDNLTESSYSILGFGNEDNEDSKIDTEIIDVSRYMEIMEKLLSSDNDFDLEKEELTNSSYQMRMNFKTKDLVNQQVDYNVYYNRTPLQNQNQFTLNGYIEVGDNTYDITAEGLSNDANHLSMRAAKDASNYIDMQYVKEEFGYTFYVQITKDNVVIEEVSLTVGEENGYKQVVLDFIEGDSTGSYTFRIIEEDMVKTIRIGYYIAGTESESGVITVRVMSMMNAYQYMMVIKPEGGTAYTYERGRDTTEGRGPHGMSVVSVDL